MDVQFNHDLYSLSAIKLIKEEVLHTHSYVVIVVYIRSLLTRVAATLFLCTLYEKENLRSIGWSNLKLLLIMRIDILIFVLLVFIRPQFSFLFFFSLIKKLLTKSFYFTVLEKTNIKYHIGLITLLDPYLSKSCGYGPLTNLNTKQPPMF